MVLKCAIVEKQPMQVISVLCTITAIFLVGKMIIKDIKEDSAKDARKSS